MSISAHIKKQEEEKKKQEELKRKNTAFIVPRQSPRDIQRQKLIQSIEYQKSQEGVSLYNRKNKAILTKLDILTSYNTAVHMQDTQWVNLTKDKKNLDMMCRDIERLGLKIKLRVKINKANTTQTFTIEHQKRIEDKPELAFKNVLTKEFTKKSDEKGNIYIEDVFALDKEENYKHIFYASCDIERVSSACLISKHKGILRSHIFTHDKSLNQIASKTSNKTYALKTKNKDIKLIKKALHALNLDIEKSQANEANDEEENELYNEEVQASIKLFQSIYQEPKNKIHSFKRPLSIDAEVSDQTLLALDEAIINKVKFKDPQVVHFDGEHLSFIDNQSGKYHRCTSKALHISGDNLCYKEEKQNSSMNMLDNDIDTLDNLDLSAYSIASTGVAQATSRAYYESLSRKQKHILAESIKRKLSKVGKTELVKTAKIKSLASITLSSKVTTSLGALGTGLVILDIYKDKELRFSHILNVGMIGLSTIPVFGWAIGGGYFLADIATLSISGKGIGQHLDDVVDEPLIKF